MRKILRSEIKSHAKVRADFSGGEKVKTDYCGRFACNSGARYGNERKKKCMW